MDNIEISESPYKYILDEIYRVIVVKCGDSIQHEIHYDCMRLFTPDLNCHIWLTEDSVWIADNGNLIVTIVEFDNPDLFDIVVDNIMTNLSCGV